MYRVKTLDLSAVTPVDGNELVQPGQTLSEIIVLYMPIGNQFKLKLGRDNPDFFTVQKEFSMEPKGIRENQSGVYWRNDIPQAGITVDVILVFAEVLSALT